MATMWTETRKVPIVSLLQSMRADALSAEPPDDERAAALALEIDRRQKNDEYHVQVRHVGSASDPFRCEELAAEHNRIVHVARARARAAVMATGEHSAEGSDFAALVSSEMERDAAWKRDLQRVAFLWIDAGVVDPEVEKERLWRVGLREGGARGATSLLLELAHEVRSFQDLPVPLGSA